MPTLENTFTGGLSLDLLESQQPPNTYRYLKNGMLSDRYGYGYGVVTEESNKLVANAGAKIVGEAFIERLDASVLLLEGDIISLFDHKANTVQEVARASEFGCSWGLDDQCEFIHIEYKTMQPCDELYLYFSSDCTYYRINLSELLSPTRKAALIASINDSSRTRTNCEYSCEYFKLMHCVCAPKITHSTSENGGHSLEGGVYKFAVQLEDKSGNKTNWSEVSNPIYIGSESNIAGEITSASISLTLTGLDCRYDIVNIAVINGFGNAEIVASRQYSTDGITFIYYGQKGKAVDLSEIITKGKKYFRGRNLAQKDSRLYLYQIRQEKNPNLQARILDEVDLSFITIQTSAKQAERYNFPSLQRGENYLFGVVYKYCDGTHSPVFLMAPKGGGGGSSFAAASPSKPGGTEEKYIRLRGNTQTGFTVSSGCSGGTCGGGTSTQSRGTSNGDQLDGNGEPLQNEVANWSTNRENWENSAKCDDCHPPVCCQEDDEGNVIPVVLDSDNCEGCNEDELAIANDGADFEKVQVDQQDNITDWGYDGTTNTNSTDLKDSASNMIDMVNNAEVVKREKANYTVTTAASSSTPAGDSQSTEIIILAGGGGTNEQASSAPWGDYYHRVDGSTELDMEVKVVGKWGPKVVKTVNLYPDTKDCNGDYIYGSRANQPIELFRTPEGSEDPIVEAKVKGVPNRFSPSVDPWYGADVRMLGIEVSNVPLPTNDEDWFPKPLCPNEPYRIVMVERDHINSTVQANLLATSMFAGISGGQLYHFPRHGMCSKDKCDFNVWNNESHLGQNGSQGYNLHGLDTNIGKVGLSGETLRVNAIVRAQGHRYGLYAEGKKPDDRFSGNRVDQRGARTFLNANMFEPTGGESIIRGISYINANKPSTNVPGTDWPVANANREASVFSYLTPILPGDQEDASFKMDTLDHEVPIGNAHGWNVSVIRDIPDQYGAVPGMKFIDTGVRANGRTSSVRGITGDIFIGPYSIRRTGYVSDKVGNTFNTPERPRTVCDSPDDLLLQNLDINYYPTRLPKSGDESDARNWAGGYLNRRALDVQNSNPEPQNDFYYPKVQKTLITTWLESRINPWRRATGQGDQRMAGLAYYPKLKGMNLDSYATRDLPWEDSFLNRFYYRLEQPSPNQLLRKAVIRNFIEVLIPALGLYFSSEKSNPLEVTGWFYVLPALIAYWRLVKDVVTREDYLNKMVGISDCKTDAEGGEPDNHITQFEDNYHDYNYQYSVRTNENYYKTIPLEYNTCDCSDCSIEDNTTNEIYYSNKQLAGNTADVYKNFMALQYNEIGVDRGKLKKLFRLNGQFYAHTTDGIFVIKEAQPKIETDRGLASLGVGGMVIEPIQLMEGVPEGYLGIQDPNSSIVTPIGYFFIDREAKRIYRFDGKSPQEISSKMLYSFFKNHLDFCELGACHDEKNEESTYYSLGWDNRYNRLLVTKKALNEKESFTISYYPLMGEGGTWASFHDYIPQFYMWGRDKFYSVKSGGIYQHHQKDSYLNFYGEQKDFEIEFVSNAKGETFNYESTVIHTEASIEDEKGHDITFNKIAAWNFNQGTGTREVLHITDNDGFTKQPILIEESSKIQFKQNRRKWMLNELKDHTIQSCKLKPRTLKDSCEWYPQINESIYDCNPQNDSMYTGKVLQDDHLNYRLTFGGREDVQLKLLSVKTNVQPTQH